MRSWSLLFSLVVVLYSNFGYGEFFAARRAIRLKAKVDTLERLNNYSRSSATVTRTYNVTPTYRYDDGIEDRYFGDNDDGIEDRYSGDDDNDIEDRYNSGRSSRPSRDTYYRDGKEWTLGADGYHHTYQWNDGKWRGTKDPRGYYKY